MRIELPDLSEQPYHFVACGKLIEPPESVAKAISEDRRLVAEYTTGENKCFVQLLTGGKSRHFHLEFARSDWFEKKGPKLNAEMERIGKVAEAIAGLPLKLGVQGEYIISAERMQKAPIMSLLPFTSIADGLTVKQTSGEFSVTGSLVDQISWELLGKETAFLKIRLDLEAVVTPDYCVVALDQLRIHFNLLFPDLTNE